MTGRGRYCPPRICWCGNCAWWRPIPPVDYSRYAAAAERTAAAHRRSWADHDSATWLDDRP